MDNILVNLSKHNIEHFVTKSYITCDFGEGDYRSEYHVYFKILDGARCRASKMSKLSNRDKVGFFEKKSKEFPNLKVKKLHRSELKYFLEKIDSYRVDFENEDGAVYTDPNVGFIKVDVLPE